MHDGVYNVDWHFTQYLRGFRWCCLHFAGLWHRFAVTIACMHAWEISSYSHDNVLMQHLAGSRTRWLQQTLTSQMNATIGKSDLESHGDNFFLDYSGCQVALFLESSNDWAAFIFQLTIHWSEMSTCQSTMHACTACGLDQLLSHLYESDTQCQS